MIAWTRNLVGLAVSLLIVYLALYLAYRFPNTQQRDEDHQVVAFGSSLTATFFRPAVYVDGALTGIRFEQAKPPAH